MIQSPALDRSIDALRRLSMSFFPTLRFYIVHEYVVAESDGVTFSGTPTDATLSPQLPTRVPYAPSLAGSSCIVPVGMLAYVGFANADQGKPYLVRFASGLPTQATIDATSKVSVGSSASEVDLAGANATVIRVSDKIAIDLTPGPTFGTISFIGTSIADHSKVKA